MGIIQTPILMTDRIGLLMKGFLLEGPKPSLKMILRQTKAGQTVDPKMNGRGVCRVNEALCKGCGTCASACPSGAASQRGFLDRQIYAEIEGALHRVTA